LGADRVAIRFVSENVTNDFMSNQTAQPTPEQIEQWKEKHGEVFTIEVASEPTKTDGYTLASDEDDLENARVGYIRKPDDRVLGFAFSKVPNMIEAGKALLKSCWLGGDPEILSDQTSLISAAMYCAGEFLQVKQVRLKKH
jgi:hypothetical protein